MKDNFEDLMGITIETGDAFLDKKLNSHICYKGGGGGTTTTSSIPAWLKPHVTGLLKQGEAAHKSGNLSKVAGLAGQTKAAHALGEQAAKQQGAVARNAARSQADLVNAQAVGTDRLRSNFLNQARTAGDQAATQAGVAASNRGTLGGARASRAAAAGRAQAEEQAALGFTQAANQAEQQARQTRLSAIGQTGATQQALGTQAKTLGTIGKDIQGQRQKEADATWQGLSRLGKLFGVASSSATDKSSSGGGGK